MVEAFASIHIAPLPWLHEVVVDYLAFFFARELSRSVVLSRSGWHYRLNSLYNSRADRRPVSLGHLPAGLRAQCREVLVGPRLELRPPSSLLPQ